MKRRFNRPAALVAIALTGLSLTLLVASSRADESPTALVPDVTIIYLPSIGNYGSSGGFRGYSLGTTSCNVGSAPVNWCNDNGSSGCGNGTTDDDHPVIGQNLYRLREGRFEQIGMSWLKHGFLSTNSTDSNCGPSCVSPPLGSNQLGVGCTDAYGSSLNGSRPLGRRSDVNATTGVFPYPYSSPSASVVWEQRIKVAEADLDPVPTNDRYWMEGQYIAADDAQANAGLNNASYREVQVADDGVYSLSFVGGTIREKTALYAWQALDPQVAIANADVVSEGSDIVERFEVGRRVTQVTNATDAATSWHYEYVVRNMNSDRAARAFRVEIANATITNVGFHDIDSHSGEPYSTTDWTDAVEPGAVEWTTDEVTVDPNANALRWATAYSFWFDADQGPDVALHRIELFEEGCPGTVFLTMPDSVVFGDGFECGTTGAWASPPVP